MQWHARRLRRSFVDDKKKKFLAKEKELVVITMLLFSVRTMQEFKPKFLHPFYTWKTVACLL